MEPNEVEFLAEKEMISIVPNFSQDKIYLIGVSERKRSSPISPDHSSPNPNPISAYFGHCRKSSHREV